MRRLVVWSREADARFRERLVAVLATAGDPSIVSPDQYGMFFTPAEVVAGVLALERELVDQSSIAPDQNPSDVLWPPQVVVVELADQLLVRGRVGAAAAICAARLRPRRPRPPRRLSDNSPGRTFTGE